MSDINRYNPHSTVCTRIYMLQIGFTFRKFTKLQSQYGNVLSILTTQLGKYIDTFGANNVFIVTNGSKNWVLDSLKEMSRVYQISFEGLDDSQQERRKDYWAALYNSIHSLQLKIVSAKALYGEVCILRAISFMPHSFM